MYENLQNVIMYYGITHDQINPCCYNRVDIDSF